MFKGRGVIIDVYKADNKIVTSGGTSLADINLRRTYRAIGSVATGRIPSLFCVNSIFSGSIFVFHHLVRAFFSITLM